ncbi:MAG TPA: membrane protein insertase YidC [Candidatus Limnocylindrales bacterium]|nr:membrane protein insertase YidC [Candidatus Limnocylindrales bacterium]
MAEYKNPQQEPGGDRRMLMVFAVTFALIIISQIFLFKDKSKPQPKSAPDQTSQSNAPQSQSEAAGAPVEAVSKGRAPAVTKPTGKSAVTKSAPSEVETVVENDVFRIVFTNRGAQAKSWVLKKYKDEDGHPLDLVNPLAVKFGLPLSLYAYDEDLRNQVNSALYVGSASGAITAPGELTYEYAQGDTTVRKTFQFDDTYVVSIETTVTQNGKPVQAYPMWPAAFGDQSTGPSYASAKIEYMANDKVERLAPKKVSSGNTLRGPFNWAGSQDQYFAAIFLPDNPDSAAMVTLHNSISVPKDLKNPDPNNLNHYDALGAAVGDVSGITRERLFVGPKALHVLESVRSSTAPGQINGPDLRNVVDFGFFSLIARPLFLWLLWTHEHMASNWGVCIMILTVIINLVLLPLRITSMKSALKMQKLQPQMKAIQEKYKKYPLRDPRRSEMNVEIGALYKREGANPAGGCVPLIIQMPFLFAFYSMLGVGIELRQAPFLWLHDLSSPDKIFILPVLIVITTFLVQKMTPNAGMDPKQQQMMTLMMPLMIGFFSYSLPAGLSVYWTVGNFIAIAQQYIMNRTGLGREMREEMEKRARKKASK